jgi:PAS domain S-box-containing protein
MPEPLAELAERHNLLVQDNDTGLLVHDADGITVSANEAAERLLGLPSADMIGRIAGDARWATVGRSGAPMSADDHPVVRALTSGESVRNAIIGVHRPTDDGDGAYVWLEVGSEPLIDERSSRPYAVVSSLRDVTHLVKSDLALRESEARYRLLADNSSDVITRTTLRGLITWISPSVRHLLGYSPQGLVGAPSAYLVHPEDLPTAIRAYKALSHASPDDVRTLSLRLRRRGGAYVDVEVALHAVLGPDGEIAEIQSSTRDVSARVAAERARRSAEDVFRLAMEHAPMGMAVLALDGQWVTFNSALPRLTDYDTDAFAALSMLDLVHHDDASADARRRARGQRAESAPGDRVGRRGVGRAQHPADPRRRRHAQLLRRAGRRHLRSDARPREAGPAGSHRSTHRPPQPTRPPGPT